VLVPRIVHIQPESVIATRAQHRTTRYAPGSGQFSLKSRPRTNTRAPFTWIRRLKHGLDQVVRATIGSHAIIDPPSCKDYLRMIIHIDSAHVRQVNMDLPRCSDTTSPGRTVGNFHLGRLPSSASVSNSIMLKDNGQFLIRGKC